MDIDKLKARVREITAPVLSDMGVELDDMELKKMGSKFLLRIFIDKEGGVTIDDCAKASREIEAQLDVQDPMPAAYMLEVSSPGLDRPLRKPGDFKRFSGKTVRIVTLTAIENQTFFIGEISVAGDAGVELLLPKGRVVNIPYENISRARLEVKV